jgi:hypothetical protein
MPHLLLPLSLDNHVLRLFRVVLLRTSHHSDFKILNQVWRQRANFDNGRFQPINNRTEFGVNCRRGRSRDGE